MKRLLLALSLVLACPAVSSAHFIWLLSNPSAAPGKVQVFFGEAAEADDPDLLDKIAAAKLWVVDGRGEPQLLPLTKGTDALEATLPDGQKSATLILEHNYGVMAKGGPKFLLKYYAKTSPSVLPGTWEAVYDKERLPLEIIARIDQGQVSLETLWQGQSQPEIALTIVGPGIEDKIEGVTGPNSRFLTMLPGAGVYSIRAKHVETVAGQLGEDAYESIKHYSTLTLHYQPTELQPEPNQLPELPQGTTSFGGAVAGGTLYVYGGNYGDAHSYSDAGQSGDLYKLNLRDPQAWDKVTGGTKLQGLAMVGHHGHVYRVGGFTAMNTEGADEKLVSQSGFARLKADGATWEALPEMPQPRSSHDVAVVGDTLYAVGGWNMPGDSKSTTWHENLIAYDLSAADSKWVELAPPPFIRRALATAAWNGQLVCIGGMNKQGGPTTEVAIYDPANNTWSTGPTLLGGNMDGFGSSAFAVGDQLIVTTVTGSIQSLRDGADAWAYLGQLNHSRFFHRVLPMDNDRLVIIGGSGMEEGKITVLEVLKLAPTSVAGK